MNNNQKEIVITGRTVLRLVSVLAIIVLSAYSLLEFVRGQLSVLHVILLLLALSSLILNLMVQSKH